MVNISFYENGATDQRLVLHGILENSMIIARMLVRGVEGPGSRLGNEGDRKAQCAGSTLVSSFSILHPCVLASFPSSPLCWLSRKILALIGVFCTLYRAVSTLRGTL